MASIPALIFHEDGTIEATAELKQKLDLTPGARLELIQQSGVELRFRMPAPMKEITGWRDLEGILTRTPIEALLPADLDSNPMGLRGFLRNSDFDPNASLAHERAWELAREDWLYGPHNEK